MNTPATTSLKPDDQTRAFTGRDYVRELVRQRDKRTCQMCGTKWELGMRRFDIHHIRECGSKSKAYDRISDIGNLITYCHRCHMGLDMVMRKIKGRTGQFKHSKEAHQHPFYRDSVSE